MRIYKLQLISKNNLSRGSYLYMPIVEDGGKYFFCNSIKTAKVTRAAEIPLASITVRREIPAQYYEANGIKS